MIVTGLDVFGSMRRGFPRSRITEFCGDDELVIMTSPKQPETPRKRPLTTPRPRRPAVHVELQQQRAFEQYSRIQERKRRHRMDIVNRYEEQMAAYDARKFRERFSPQRMVSFASRRKDKGVVETIARQRSRKATPIFSD